MGFWSGENSERGMEKKLLHFPVVISWWHSVNVRGDGQPTQSRTLKRRCKVTSPTLPSLMSRSRCRTLAVRVNHLQVPGNKAAHSTRGSCFGSSLIRSRAMEIIINSNIKPRAAWRQSGDLPRSVSFLSSSHQTCSSIYHWRV